MAFFFLTSPCLKLNNSLRTFSKHSLVKKETTVKAWPFPKYSSKIFEHSMFFFFHFFLLHLSLFEVCIPVENIVENVLVLTCIDFRPPAPMPFEAPPSQPPQQGGFFMLPCSFLSVYSFFWITDSRHRDDEERCDS